MALIEVKESEIKANPKLIEKLTAYYDSIQPLPKFHPYVRRYQVQKEGLPTDLTLTDYIQALTKKKPKKENETDQV